MCQLLILHWCPPWNILGQCVVRGMNIQSGPNIYESSSVRLRVARLRALAGPIETFDFRAVASHRKLGARGPAVACLEKGIRRSPGDSVGGSATFVGNHNINFNINIKKKKYIYIYVAYCATYSYKQRN